VKGQGHRTGFSDTFSLRNGALLLLATPIAIGRRWRQCSEYCSMPRQLLRTDL